MQIANGDSGQSAVTGHLPFEWHNSPNVHFFTLKDFDRFCEKLGVRVEKKIGLSETRVGPVKFVPNFFAEQAVYVTSRD